MNIVLAADQNIVLPLADLIGSYRRFGERGPVYEVVGPSRENSSVEVELRVRVVESGEEHDYRLRDVLADPIER